MIESEWLSSGDPHAMLECLRGKIGERKLRLLAVACHRRIWDLLNDQPDSCKTLEFAERFADGLATTTDLHGHAWGKPGKAFSTVLYRGFDAAENSLEFAAGMIQQAVLEEDAELYKEWEKTFDTAFKTYPLGEAKQLADARMPPDWIAKSAAACALEHAAQCALIQEIFGPLPFRFIEVDRSRLVPKVAGMAERIYAERAFELLPELADNLAATAFSNGEIVSHLREPAPHVKGCWALDLILGKM